MGRGHSDLVKRRGQRKQEAQIAHSARVLESMHVFSVPGGVSGPGPDKPRAQGGQKVAEVSAVGSAVPLEGEELLAAVTRGEPQREPKDRRLEADVLAERAPVAKRET